MVFLWFSPQKRDFSSHPTDVVQVDWKTLAPPQLVNHYEHLGESESRLNRGDNSTVYQAKYHGKIQRFTKVLQ